MFGRLPALPQLEGRTVLAILGVICLLVIPTGAALYNEIDRFGPDESLALEPYDGPNGAYAEISSDRQLTVNVTDAGVNPDAKTDIARVFTITNHGSDETQIWITHTNEHAVTFYDDSTGNPITEADQLRLASNDQVVVSLRVDTTLPGVNAGDTLRTHLYIHTRTFTVAQPLVAAPDNMAFGNVTLDTTETQDVEIHNPGNATLALSNPTITGPDAAAFTLNTTGSLPLIQPGATETIPLTFSPDATGSHTATLDIETNATTTPTITINTSGTGVAPGLVVVTETPLDFGSVHLGATERRTLTLRNDGTSSLPIESFELTGTAAGAYTIETDPTPLQLAPGDTVDVTVAFSPTTLGSKTASFDVTGSDDSTLLEVALLGRGDVAQLAIEPSSVEFGGVGTGKTANATVTLTSTGTRPVSMTIVGFGGSDASQFSVDATSVPDTLQPGETATLTVQYQPTTAGNHSAILTIDTNATDAQTATLPVAGTGLPPQIGVGDDNIDFGNVTVGASKTLNVTVWNEETSPTDLTVHSTFIVGANPEAFTITGGQAPFTLAPGETKDVQVTYNPDSPGIKTAQLRILSDAGNMPQIDVWMSNAGWRIRVQEVAPDSAGVDGDDESWAMDPEIVTPDSVRVEMDADDIPAGMLLNVNVSQPNTRSGAAGIDEVRLRVQREGSFDMNFIHATVPPTRDSPIYTPPDDRRVVQHITLWHSIDNADFTEPSVTYRIRKTEVPATATPEDVEFLRYVDGEWTHPDATLLRETTTHYVYRIDLPGLSEFVITSPTGTATSNPPGSPASDPPNDPSDPEPDESPADQPEPEAAPSGPTVQDGNTTITFPGANETTDLSDRVSVVELPVPTPGSTDRDGPQAAISTQRTAGGGVETLDVGHSGVSVSISTDDQYVERIQANGADAMAIVNEPLPLTASHSLFSSKDSIDDHWRMIRQMEITVPPEYEDQPATIRIRVPLAAFQATDPEDATIARQHNGWQLLPTEVVDRTETEVVLQAETPGFSVFAIFADNEVAYEWEVENHDEPLTSATIEPTFETPDIYNVTLTITDAFGLTDTATYRILANDVPTVTIDRGSPVTPHETATLVATVDDSMGNVTVEWHFPDGSTATGRVVDYSFASGLQRVEVVATDEFGARGTTDRLFVVGGGSVFTLESIDALSPDWLLVALLALLAAFIVARRYWGGLPLSRGHAPEITRLADPLLELGHRRVVVPELDVIDRGGDLAMFQLDLRTEDDAVVATGTGAIDGGRSFEATSVVLRITTEEELTRDHPYRLTVTVTDDAGTDTTRTVSVKTDPFVYPHASIPHRAPT